ncbi:MAG: hypothetical protein AB7K14_15415 [Lysobacterales bacterium]
MLTIPDRKFSPEMLVDAAMHGPSPLVVELPTAQKTEPVTPLTVNRVAPAGIAMATGATPFDAGPQAELLANGEARPAPYMLVIADTVAGTTTV